MEKDKPEGITGRRGKTLKDKKKAAEEVQRLVNTNFTDKDLKIKISYEKGAKK